MKPDRRQFEKLVMEQLDLLYRLALSLSSPDAEDLVQETCLRALRSRHTFDLRQFGIRPWLVRILNNTHRSRKLRSTLEPQPTGELPDPPAPDIPAFSHDVFQHMDQRLVRALTQLPEEHRTTLLLWAIEDLSYKEIAHATNVPVGTVMSRLHRARRHLTETLAEYATSEGMKGT